MLARIHGDSCAYSVIFGWRVLCVEAAGELQPSYFPTASMASAEARGLILMPKLMGAAGWLTGLTVPLKTEHRLRGELTGRVFLGCQWLRRMQDLVKIISSLSQAGGRQSSISAPEAI